MIWVGSRWVYADNRTDALSYSGEIRPCKKCGAVFPLDEVDPCLGVLPGVDAACCGHGVRSESYVCFENGTVLKDFIVNKSPSKVGGKCKQ